MSLAPLSVYVNAIGRSTKTILFECASVGCCLLKYKAEFFIGSSQVINPFYDWNCWKCPWVLPAPFRVNFGLLNLNQSSSQTHSKSIGFWPQFLYKIRKFRSCFYIHVFLIYADRGFLNLDSWVSIRESCILGGRGCLCDANGGHLWSQQRFQYIYICIYIVSQTTRLTGSQAVSYTHLTLPTILLV